MTHAEVLSALKLLRAKCDELPPDGTVVRLFIRGQTTAADMVSEARVMWACLVLPRALDVAIQTGEIHYPTNGRYYPGGSHSPEPDCSACLRTWPCPTFSLVASLVQP